MQPELSSQEIRSLVNQFQKSNNMNILLPVIKQLHDMVRQQARRYPQTGSVGTEDLMCRGNDAIFDAAMLYNPDSQLDFEHFVFSYIHNAIRDFYNQEHSCISRPKRSKVEMYFNSFDSYIIDEDGDQNRYDQRTMEDNLLSYQPDIDPVDYRYIYEALNTLSPIEQQIIRAIFGFDKDPVTIEQLALEMNSSIDRIQNILIRAKRRLAVRMQRPTNYVPKLN